MVPFQSKLWRRILFVLILAPISTVCCWTPVSVPSINTAETPSKTNFGMDEASWLVPPEETRRRMILSGIAGLSGLGSSLSANAYTPDSDKLRESLYLISRVQEATVQQERFVDRSTMQEELKGKMKLTLRLVEKNYLLLDQINYCSSFVEPQDDVITAVEAGNIAVEALQAAIDYVNKDLKTGPLGKDQTEYLVSNLAECREQLFVFLKYMPQDKLRQARERVEDENVKNREEYAGDQSDGLFNPVKLPWKA